MTIKYINIYLMRDGSVREKEIEDVDILAQNDKYIVLNDYSFTKLEVKLEKYNSWSVLEKVAISDYTNDSFWQKYYGDFWIRLYTQTDSLKIIENRINKEFNKFIKDKVSRYMVATDIRITL